MADKLNMSLQKKRKRVKLRTRIMLLVLLVVALQLITYAVVLAFGGEYRDLREHANSGLAEKTLANSIYIQNELNEKPMILREYAEGLDNAVSGILKEHMASIDLIRQEKGLSRSILEGTADILVSLLRCSNVSDAYLILDTGELYDDAEGAAVAALYLQNSESEEGGIRMVAGFESVAEAHGFEFDTEEPEVLSLDPEDLKNFDFYYTTLSTARENSGLDEKDLGYWSGFSKVTPSAAASMKYTLPLKSGDGTVYGALGIGMSEKDVASVIPAGADICYLLTRAEGDDAFDILTHSGSGYSTLLGSTNPLRIKGGADGIYSFETTTDAAVSGSVRYIDMYEGSSPYSGERWALVSVAADADVQQPLLFLQRMLVTSTVLSLIVALIVAIPGCGVIIKPLTNLSNLIKNKRKYNEVIRFEASNIYEIDEITDAITRLQINVQDFSSQVSKMISVADVGLGTFMYDRTDDSVFVGRGLIKVLKLEIPGDGDVVMSRRNFLASIENPEVRSKIAAGLGMEGGDIQGDHSEVHRINRLNGGTFWMRLGFTYSLNTAIGIVQDITDTKIERTRIEHERDHDALTDLLTRHAYYRRVDELFKDRDALKITAFVMIDLDNLKYVNDTYGHDFGDSYIITAANALKKFKNYGGIVARLSGDEFNVCLSGFSDKEEVRRIIEEIRAELLSSTCLLADGTHYKVGASMGVSWYPDDAESRELLMKYADFAMYTVKHSTKGGIAEFDADSYSTDSDKMADLEELNRIIDESRVQYAFQSIVSVKTGEVYGYEALMRVQSEIFRSPLELLNIARANSKLYAIEQLTWTRSVADFQTLVNAKLVKKDAYLFVNSVANYRLDEDVVAMIEKNYPHLLSHIVMELLESEGSEEESIAHKKKIISKWGGQMALDDYGTGYNSEYALLSIQPNIIKIDRSIISGCDHDADRRMIIGNVVKLASAKGIRVLAEGVETAEEMEAVISCGVDFLQGYYLARPIFEPGPIDPKLSERIRHLADQKSEEESL